MGPSGKRAAKQDKADLEKKELTDKIAELKDRLERGIPSDLAKQKAKDELAQLERRLEPMTQLKDKGKGKDDTKVEQDSPGDGKEKPKMKKDIGLEDLTARIDSLLPYLNDLGHDGKMPTGRFSTEPATQQIHLTTNYFKISTGKVETLYKYTVAINDKTISARMRRRILWLLLRQISTSEIMAKVATDYHQTLVAVTKLPQYPFTQAYEVDYYGEGETQPRDGPQKKLFTVTLDHEADLPIRHLLNFVKDPLHPELPADFNVEVYANAFNILLSRKPNQDLQVQQVGSMSFFDTRIMPPLRRNLTNGLEAYIGFTRSVRASKGQLLINVNSTASAFYFPINVNELIKQWSGPDHSKEYRDRVLLDRFIKGIRVRALHGTGRVYTIFGLAPWDGGLAGRPISAIVTFPKDLKDADGKKTGKTTDWTVKKFFQTSYPNKHRDYDALVINCGSAKDHKYLPADTLEVLPGNSYRRLLSGQQVEPMQQLACVYPSENVNRILQTGRRLYGIERGANVENPSTRFGLSIDTELLKVQGQKLAPPLLQYKAQKPFEGAGKGDWDLRTGQLLVQPCYPARWCVVEFSPSGKRFLNKDELKDFSHDLGNGIAKYCPNMIAVAADGDAPQFLSGNREQLRDNLRVFQDAEIDILFVVLPDDDAGNYALLKHVADVDVGIHTICTVRNKRWKSRDQWFKNKLVTQLKHDPNTIANLLLKCNLKLGGDNWTLSAACRDEVASFLTPTTMIVGADVTHPGPGSMTDTDSVAAVVASEDDGFNRYPASFRCQASRMEMIDQFDQMLGERLEHWKDFRIAKAEKAKEAEAEAEKAREVEAKKDKPADGKKVEGVAGKTAYDAKGKKASEPKSAMAKATDDKTANEPEDETATYPTSIIIYRDGVSESQFEQVINLEYPQIQKIIKDKYNLVNQEFPKIMMLSVQKRHHTRFYPDTDKDNHGNAYPGLVVDRGVTYPDKYNWFQQSHHCIIGTARPAHYVVLVDTIKAPVDVVQKATHWQSFLFTRCCKSISVHPAARLADRACNRARAYLRNYYVAERRCNDVFDRNGVHHDAWDPTSTHDGFDRIKNTMFYI